LSFPDSAPIPLANFLTPNPTRVPTRRPIPIPSRFRGPEAPVSTQASQSSQPPCRFPLPRDFRATELTFEASLHCYNRVNAKTSLRTSCLNRQPQEIRKPREKPLKIMNLYVLRHANAGTPRKNEALDAKRPLDKEGKQQCLLVATTLNALNVQFDLIASSPLKRAMQTASLVGMEMGYEAKLHITEALNFTGKPADFQKLVTELSVHENVLVVGHNPNLEEFLGSLITKAPAAAGAKGDLPKIRLRKAALARVDCTRRPGTLLWVLDSRMLKTVYSSVTKSSRRKTSKK
jgi:phosphohistidine phosphatase